MFGLMRKKTHRRIVADTRRDFYHAMDTIKSAHKHEMEQANILPKETKDSYLTLPAKMKEKYRDNSNDR